MKRNEIETNEGSLFAKPDTDDRLVELLRDRLNSFEKGVEGIPADEVFSSIAKEFGFDLKIRKSR